MDVFSLLSHLRTFCTAGSSALMNAIEDSSDRESGISFWLSTGNALLDSADADAAGLQSLLPKVMASTPGIVRIGDVDHASGHHALLSLHGTVLSVLRGHVGAQGRDRLEYGDKAEVRDLTTIFSGKRWDTLRAHLEREVAAMAAPSMEAGSTHNEPHAAADDTIILQADHCYRIGQRDAIWLTETEDKVLRCFIGRSALDLETLKDKSNAPNARDVLRGLTTKYGGRFSPAIKMAGAKGAGGYRVRIQKEE